MRCAAWCISGVMTALLVWAIAALVGYPEVAPLVDHVIAALGLIVAVSLFTGVYLGRPHGQGHITPNPVRSPKTPLNALPPTARRRAREAQA